MSQIPGCEPMAQRPTLPFVNEIRRVLREGVVRELRRLGGRPTELVHLLGIPRATVTRFIRATKADPSFIRHRQLTARQQWVVTAFWYEIAGRHGINPPPLDQLLRSFCDVCRGADDRPSASSRHFDLLEEFSLRAVTARPSAEPVPLEEIYRQAHRLCRREPRPEACVTGAARFGLLCAGLSAAPWPIAIFLTQHVHERGCWVRMCSQCEQRFVSESPAHKHCGCRLNQEGPQPLSPARVARTELSVRA